MLLFAHLAAGYLAGRLWNRIFLRRPINSLVAMLGGILPDLIDKPLSLHPEWDSTRTIGHTLGFTIILFLLAKGYRSALPLALGTTTHLILDNPFTYAQTLFWPLLGPEFRPGGGFTLGLVFRQLRDVPTGLGEIAGAIVLLVVAARHVLIVSGVIEGPKPKPTEEELRSERFRTRLEEQRRREEQPPQQGPPAS